MHITRRLIQAAFLVLVIVGVFVLREHCEWWCPFGAVEGIHAYVVDGSFPCSLGVTNLFVFGGVIVSVLLIRRAFCGYLCPIGILSDWSHAIGRFLRLPRISVPSGLDKVLSFCKYPILVVLLYLHLDVGRSHLPRLLPRLCGNQPAWRGHHVLGLHDPCGNGRVFARDIDALLPLVLSPRRGHEPVVENRTDTGPPRRRGVYQLRKMCKGLPHGHPRRQTGGSVRLALYRMSGMCRRVPQEKGRSPHLGSPPARWDQPGRRER